MAYRELLDPRLIAIEASLLLGVVALFAVIGPLATDDSFGLAGRVAYWGACAAVCWPLCYGMDTLTLYFARSCAPILIVAVATFDALFMAMPCAAVVYTVRGLFPSPEAADLGLAETYLLTAAVLVLMSSLMRYVACQRVKLRVVTGTATVDDRARSPEPLSGAASGDAPPAGPRAVDRGTAGPEATSDARPPIAQHRAVAPPTRFFDRLPPKLGRDIIFLKADSHYVEVFTTEGSEVTLMRFADAVAELGDLGTQVHRSYWVAYRHAVRLVRRDHLTMLRITGGREVPVSRTHRAALRDRLQNRTASDHR